MKKTEEQSEKVGLLIMLDSTLRDDFKIKTIKEHTTMADVLNNMIKEYVEE